MAARRPHLLLDGVAAVLAIVQPHRRRLDSGSSATTTELPGRCCRRSPAGHRRAHAASRVRRLLGRASRRSTAPTRNDTYGHMGGRGPQDRRNTLHHWLAPTPATAAAGARQRRGGWSWIGSPALKRSSRTLPRQSAIIWENCSCSSPTSLLRPRPPRAPPRLLRLLPSPWLPWLRSPPSSSPRYWT